MQATPREFGLVLWRGGQGRPGEMGGWGYQCKWCQAGDQISAAPRKKTADAMLFNHVAALHSLRQVQVGSFSGTVRDYVEMLTETTQERP